MALLPLIHTTSARPSPLTSTGRRRDVSATPAGGSYPSLTAGEATGLRRIRSEGHGRLEQERIPWQVALAALTVSQNLSRHPVVRA